MVVFPKFRDYLFLFLACWLLRPFSLYAQDPPATKEEFLENYQRRIQQEYINFVYIPKDLTDAFVQLTELTDKESRLKFKNMSEEDAARKLHFSLGRWIILNWGFYEGSRLSHYIRENLGIYHPDDMAEFIIVTYHRSLNRKPLAVKELVEYFHQKQEEEKQERINRGTIISEETRKRNKG